MIGTQIAKSTRRQLRRCWQKAMQLDGATQHDEFAGTGPVNKAILLTGPLNEFEQIKKVMPY